MIQKRIHLIMCSSKKRLPNRDLSN
uniref:Uncharacterized protein n=1 Tax=Arundo donax TaxID=35708 RepID=A0A0A8XXF9_ARUDO